MLKRVRRPLATRDIIAAEQAHAHALLMLAILITLSLAIVFFCFGGVGLSTGRRGLPPLDELLTPVVITLIIVSLPWGLYLRELLARPILPSLYRELERHGPRYDVMARIDKELQDPEDAWTAGYWPQSIPLMRPEVTAVTRSWLMSIRGGQCAVVHLRELVWVHREVVSSRLWTTGPSFRFHLGCRLVSGELKTIVAKTEADSNDLFEELLERRPALLAGWHGDYADLLQRGPEALADAYAEREKQFLALTPEQREEWLDRSWHDFQSLILNAG